jgi:hypothetical protein
MTEMERVLTDVPQDQVAFQKSLLESDDFVVEVREQRDGLFTLIGTKPE